VNTTNLKLIRRRIYAKELPLKTFNKKKTGRIMNRQTFNTWKKETKIKDKPDK
jgi:hypothetical protein